ncbi:hypothetical protein [Kitasatospora sp. MBT66]|uniref:hypothetical protein n=1 Tax=Kitasatospora sp. MBT66 TaxID=1444769 RepID=UPI0005BA58BF|nr:hypothetical protein [Kitasatospora sp. MBT66]
MLPPAAGPGPRVALYAVGPVVLVAGAVLRNVVLGSFRQTCDPPALLGRVVATSVFANRATIPIRAVAGGTLGATLGLRATMWITAVPGPGPARAAPGRNRCGGRAGVHGPRTRGVGRPVPALVVRICTWW